MRKQNNLCGLFIASIILISAVQSSSIETIQIQWVVEELEGDIVQQDVASWGSLGTFSTRSEESLLVKSSLNSTDTFISKTFCDLPPHYFLIVRLQVFQIGSFRHEEGIIFVIDDQEATASRLIPATRVRRSGRASVYFEEFGFTHKSPNATIKLIAVTQGRNRLAINDFHLGVVGCHASCQDCGYPTDKEEEELGEDIDEVICRKCPNNSSLSSDRKACVCSQGFKESYETGSFVCVPDKCISDEIKQNLTDYSLKSRVVVEAVSYNNLASADDTLFVNIYSYQYYPTLSAAEISNLAFGVGIFDNSQNKYIQLPSTYIESTVFGEYVLLCFKASQVSALINANYTNSITGFTTQEIRLSLRFLICTGILREHYFSVLLSQKNGVYTYVSAKNTDYLKNQNQISIDSFRSPAILQSENQFEVKRYLCTNVNCTVTRSYQGYAAGYVFVRFGFQSKQNTRILNLSSAILFTDNSAVNILPEIQIDQSGQGFLILHFKQHHLFADFSSDQTVNKVYLQLTAVFREVAGDQNSRLRTIQTTLLIYEISGVSL